jgi:hypothetical protein
MSDIAAPVLAEAEPIAEAEPMADVIEAKDESQPAQAAPTKPFSWLYVGLLRLPRRRVLLHIMIPFH